MSCLQINLPRISSSSTSHIAADMGLNGEIPPEIQHLDRLEVLNLQFNPGLHGTLPVELSYMSDLKHLALQYNGFKGTIPEWIGEFTALKYLGLGNNMFTGPIPTSIVSLTNLEVLGLDDNLLSANIELFEPLSKLKSLYLEDNGILGTLSYKLLESWPEMMELDLSNNLLHGKLPPTLFMNEKSKLRVLDLHGNAFVGSIPKSIPYPNYNLEFLALHENRLSSTVPASLTNLKMLRHLDISRNELTSTLPDELGEMTELQYLFTANNAFSQGRLPSFVEMLTNLRELGMKDNGLTGQLPEFISYLTNLKFLDLRKSLSTMPPIL
jgi:Leucine-rich repeat (LRR) protein